MVKPAEKQAKDIYAYIRTFKAAQPDLKNIPLLEPDGGRRFEDLEKINS